MNALAAGQLGPGGKALSFHQVAHSQSGHHHRLPWHSVAGIEVDYDLVGTFKVIDVCVPGMQLDCTYFDQPQKSFEVIHPQPRSLPAFALLDPELVNCFRNVLGK